MLSIEQTAQKMTGVMVVITALKALDKEKIFAFVRKAGTVLP